MLNYSNVELSTEKLLPPDKRHRFSFQYYDGIK